MKNIRQTLMAGLLAAIPALTATAQTSLTPEVMNELRTSYQSTPENRALRNAISSVGIQKIALNQEHTQAKDTYCNVEVRNTGISDQQSSGRCWLFTGTNVLRNQAMKRLGVKDFFLSQVHLFFYDQLEKSNLFLQSIIDTRRDSIDSEMVRWLFQHPLSDGGTYTGVADLVSKYGCVPQDVMSETAMSNATSEFNQHLRRKLREYGIRLRQEAEKGASAKKLEHMKVEQLKTVYRMLVMAYGLPPQQFTWAPRKDGKYLSEPKTYTPQQFYREVCSDGSDLNEDYVMLMNDPSRPYGKTYEIDKDRHTYDGHNWRYLNLDMEDLKPLAIASLKDSAQMYFSCDVGKFLDRQHGYLSLDNFDYESLLGTGFGMNKKERIQSFDSGSTHAMTLMGVNLDQEGRPTLWKVENSWGKTAGMDGYLVMTDQWFDEYMFRVVVHRKYLTPEILRLLDQKPVMLPAWDPMFKGEE